MAWFYAAEWPTFAPPLTLRLLELEAVQDLRTRHEDSPGAGEEQQLPAPSRKARKIGAATLHRPEGESIDDHEGLPARLDHEQAADLLEHSHPFGRLKPGFLSLEPEPSGTVADRGFLAGTARQVASSACQATGAIFYVSASGARVS